MADAQVGLSTLVIRSCDLTQARKFYTTLGLKFADEQHESGILHLSCQLGPTSFEIYPWTADDRESLEARIGFHVPSLDDTLVEVEKQGFGVASPPKQSPWGRFAVVIDPDGRKVELFDSPQE